MKKIKLFLWGTVSTFITLFYGTEISAYTLTVSTRSSRTNCSGYNTNADTAEDQLTTRSNWQILCKSNEIFLGCTKSGIKYLASNYTTNQMAIYCNGGTGICTTTCPSPGSAQAKQTSTAMYKALCTVLCSSQDAVTGGNLGGYYLQTLCLRLANNSSDFVNINRQSNTCAINTDVSFNDTSGSYVYGNKCYYTE